MTRVAGQGGDALELLVERPGEVAVGALRARVRLLGTMPDSAIQGMQENGGGDKRDKWSDSCYC